MGGQMQGPKGTRDFYPADMAFEQHIFDSWHKSCRKHGFEQYEGPMFEHLELYTQKSGDEIERQLYTFKDKGGRDLALRPELTPTLARMAAAQGTNLKRPARWYSVSRLFRYERMQKGRLREFVQLNMDILGADEPAADAELIAAAIGMMRDLGLGESDFKARVSSRALLEEFFRRCGVNSDKKENLNRVYGLLDKKNKMPADDFYRELGEIEASDNFYGERETVADKKDIRAKIQGLFDCKTLNDVDNFLKRIESVRVAPYDSVSRLKRIFELIDACGYGGYLVFDIGIIRGLQYYTGTVFELFDVNNSMRAIAGGGRYDGLVGLYGGPPTPAVGFAAGDVVLGDLIKEKGIAPAPPPRSGVYIVSLGGADYAGAVRAARLLRDRGVSCEFSLKESQSVGKQLKSADAARSRYALLIGGEEAESGQMRLKNLSDGSEKLVKSDEIADVLAEMKL